MKKLLIVDDEQIEREGIQVILQRAFPELIIEQAKNGKIAVEMATEFRPDLILMDIKMPGMNGLEAIERISAELPNIKFVMVTAYDTFDYARLALKLGVKDYLLKPSTANEIVATVGRVLKQTEEEQKSLAMNEHQKEALQKALTLVETDVVTQLLFDHVHEVHLDMLVEMLDIRSTNEKFVMIVLLPAGSENYYSTIKEKVRRTKSGWVGAMYGRQLPIIVFREPDITFRSQAKKLANEILSAANSDLREGWFVGIGNVCDSLEQIRQSYQESLIATMDTSLQDKYRFYEDVPVLGTLGEGQLDKQREKQYLDKVRLGQWEQARMYVMNVIQRYENEGANLLQTQQRVLELLWIATRVMNEMGVETNTPLYSFQAQDFRQLRAETGHLLDRMKHSYVEHYDRLEADTIHQIKHYIIEHSHEDISLDALSRKVGLSPIYISKIFKEKLGINYIDFLTECRIKKAKQLMGDPEKSIKEITFEVGYHEPNYFSKVFKKMCGTSPKEFRKTLLGTKS
ncbi:MULTISPECIES: response regulator [unclassified Bacillus (in: firmicutes)]|uniref:response regulator n=1 Tax=unclassified Bacillus (in: firmicutes) TaxID=185979 RepID=UPI0008F37EE1|nr:MULTISPECIES: response regulator [unclassified Bacillus (in: firmicutes)]SFB14309.1 two-component system, response regulator YesN [Bacillus sp. UNCCL13]SFQ89750.1 two-component system, response regulator YesN [Bacillus sp. cl95]